MMLVKHSSACFWTPSSTPVRAKHQAGCSYINHCETCWYLMVRMVVQILTFVKLPSHLAIGKWNGWRQSPTWGHADTERISGNTSCHIWDENISAVVGLNLSNSYQLGGVVLGRGRNGQRLFASEQKADSLWERHCLDVLIVWYEAGSLNKEKNQYVYTIAL